MKLSHVIDHDSLAALGAEAVGLLCRGDLETLASQYGYVFSHGRAPEVAIRHDLQYSLSQVGAGSLVPVLGNPVQAVRFYLPNNANIVAVVECLASTDNGASVMVELVVTRAGEDTYITLEEISPAG